ncbi:hypothetical protein NPM06_33010, partial [Bacillus cereus]|nr:hypothetical protein [Bacillus cereus]
MLIEFLEFISILALVVVLTLTVMLQDIFFININKQYTETRIGAIIFCIRMLFGTWVVFVTETTIFAVSKVTACFVQAAIPEKCRKNSRGAQLLFLNV